MVNTSLVFDLIARDRASRTVLGVGRSFDSTGSKIARMASRSAVGIGLVTAAAGVFTFKVGASYVATLNQIQAVTGANTEQMNRAAGALESNSGQYAKLGQTTGDAAAGVVELAKSGLSLRQSLHAVYGTMVLAKAGALEVGDASAITANALNTFHLKAKAAGDVANYLANAANISSADVADIAESFKYVAPVAASAGVTIQQTNAILAELANSGIKASQAGTSLRTFLLNLQAPTAAASAALQDLGVNIYDSSGKMKPLADVIGLLKGKLDGLTQAQRNANLKAIFGKTGISGATTILNEGAKGLARYTKGVEKAGSAQKLAESKSKGLAGSLNTIKSSAISAAQELYRKLSPIADKVIRPLAQKFATFAQNLGPNIDKGLAKIKSIFGKFNIAGLGKKLADQAKAWAGPVISGFNAGLNTGDWSGLGKALGNGLVKAAGALGDLSGKFGEILGKIDWVGIGIDIGKQAPSLFVGLAAGLLNFDLLGLLKGVAKHWQDVLLAVIALAFTPGRIVGKVGELLAKIPFVGKLLEWGLLAMKRFSDRMVGAVGKALGFLGRAFLSGFRKVFPEVGSRFAKELALFPTRVGVVAINVAEKGLKMVRGLGNAIAKGAGWVASKIGELIGRILKPWVNANTWLIRKGVEILGGLLKGIGSMIGKVLAPFRQMSGRILSAVGDLSHTLWNAGVNLIKGLIGGIGSMFGSVKNKLGELTGKLTSWKGPPDKDRSLLTPAGVMLMEGLVKGIEKGTTSVKRALEKVTGYISSQRDKLNNLLSAKADFAQGFQSFTTSVFSADLSHTTTDAAGNDVTTPGTVQDILAYQAQERAKARSLKRDVKRLHKMGLSDALIRQLQASGESGVAQIHTLAGGTRADVQKLNRLDKQTRQALRSAGNTAADQLYNRSIADTRNNEDLAERIARKLKAALHDAKKGEELVIKDVNGQWIIKAIRKEKRTTGQASAV